MKEGECMRSFKRWLLIFIITIFSVISSGCWNYREIDQLGIGTGMAVDRDPISNDYIVSVELINISSDTGKLPMYSEIYTSKSKTMFDAIRNVIEITGKRIFWGHAKILIISEDIAKEGLIPVIDWSLRDSEIRNDIDLLIAKGSSAENILKNKHYNGNSLSFHIDNILKNQKSVTKYVDTKLFRNKIEIEKDNFAATVETVSVKEMDNKRILVVDGSAIFKGDKLVGYLDGNETMQMLMLRNKLSSGVIPLKNVCNSNTDITLEIFNNNTKLNSIYSDGELTLRIDVYTTVAIDEQAGNEDFISVDKRRLLQQYAEMRIKENLDSLVLKMQRNYDADVFGFQEFIEKNNPKIYKEFKKNNKDFFNNLQTDINVHISIKGSATRTNTIKAGK